MAQAKPSVTQNWPATEVQLTPTDKLIPYARNSRTHSDEQVSEIAASIKEWGFTTPVLVDEESTLIAGHGRLLAAQKLGLEQIPVMTAKGWTDAQKKAYVIADNKLALNAGWDDEILATELGALYELDLDFDVEITGFTISEVDNLIDGLSVEEDGDPRDDQQPEDPPARCQLGDLWQLGPHRLICGDAVDPDTVAQLMNGHQVKMVFTDPPYNVPIDGHVGNSGKTKHREFAMAAGEMSREQFTDFLKSTFQNLSDHSSDGSIHFVCMDWRHMSEILNAGEAVYDELKNMIIWVKDNGGMGTFYRSRHELIFAFKKGTAPHTNTFELGQHGRYRTNVWEYKGVNTLRKGRMEELSLHPTAKPVQMIADAIKDVSAKNDIVLDLFGGSGSTLIAAHKTGRKAYLCELDPIYCDRIIARWEAYAHDEATLVRPAQPAEVAQ